VVADADVPGRFQRKLDRERGVKEMDGSGRLHHHAQRGEDLRGKMFIDATYVGDLMAAG
jgi:hypothetical protein